MYRRPYAQELVSTYEHMRPIIHKKKKQMLKSAKSSTKYDKKLADASKKHDVEKKKRFVLEAIPECDGFSSFARYFGVGQTSLWLARTGVGLSQNSSLLLLMLDPRLAMEGFEAVKEHLVGEDFPVSGDEIDDDQLEAWKVITNRLRSCKVLYSNAIFR